MPLPYAVTVYRYRMPLPYAITVCHFLNSHKGGHRSPFLAILINTDPDDATEYCDVSSWVLCLKANYGEPRSCNRCSKCCLQKIALRKKLNPNLFLKRSGFLLPNTIHPGVMFDHTKRIRTKNFLMNTGMTWSTRELTRF